MTDKKIFHVAISGEIGSGKSSVARRLAERLDGRLFSTGGIQREIAKKRGMTTLELNLFAEAHPEIDKEIDGFTISLSGADYSFVIDSRLAWNFLRQSFKVNLLVDHGVAVERIMGDKGRGQIESYRSRAAGVAEVAARRASERRRFREKYGVDVENPRNFDLIVDTTKVPVEHAVDRVHQSLLANAAGQSWPALWLCPRTILPTRGFAEVRDTAGTQVEAEPEKKIQVIIVDGKIFALDDKDDHLRVSAAIRSGCSLIAAELVAADEEEISAGIKAHDFAKEHTTKSRVGEWEKAHDLQFSTYPAFMS